MKWIFGDIFNWQACTQIAISISILCSVRLICYSDLVVDSRSDLFFFQYEEHRHLSIKKRKKERRVACT